VRSLKAVGILVLRDQNEREVSKKMKTTVFLADISMAAASAGPQRSTNAGTDSAKRVDSIVGKMSLEEKLNYIGQYPPGS
jgi:hypothetical protein